MAYTAWQRKMVAVEVTEDGFVFEIPRVFARCQNCDAWAADGRRWRGMCTTHNKRTAWCSSCPCIIMRDATALRVLDEIRSSGHFIEYGIGQK